MKVERSEIPILYREWKIGSPEKRPSGLAGNRKPETPKKCLRGRPETGNRNREKGVSSRTDGMKWSKWVFRFRRFFFGKISWHVVVVVGKWERSGAVDYGRFSLRLLRCFPSKWQVWVSVWSGCRGVLYERRFGEISLSLASLRSVEMTGSYFLFGASVLEKYFGYAGYCSKAGMTAFVFYLISIVGH